MITENQRIEIAVKILDELMDRISNYDELPEYVHLEMDKIYSVLVDSEQYLMEHLTDLFPGDRYK